MCSYASALLLALTAKDVQFCFLSSLVCPYAIKDKPFRDEASLFSGKNQNHRVIDFTVSQALKMFYMYPIGLVEVWCGKHVEKLLNSIYNELTFRANGYR